MYKKHMWIADIAVALNQNNKNVKWSHCRSRAEMTLPIRVKTYMLIIDWPISCQMSLFICHGNLI